MSEQNRQGDFSVDGVFRAVEVAISSAVQATISPAGNLVREVDRFRVVRGKTLGMLEEVTALQALWCPRPRAWSIAQVADHLLLSEALFRDQFQLLIQAAKEGRSSAITIGFNDVDNSVAGIPRGVIGLFEIPLRMFSRFVPRAALETMVRYPIVSALNPKLSEPRNGLKIEILIAELKASLAETEEVLLAPMPTNIDGPIIDHPLMGRNNLPELVRIVIAHEERHHRQIAAVRNETRFPEVAVR